MMATSSTLDYAFAPPSLGMTSVLYHHVARSGYGVLIFDSSSQKKTQSFKGPNEKLFENKKFTELAKRELLEASRVFFLIPQEEGEEVYLN